MQAPLALVKISCREYQGVNNEDLVTGSLILTIYTLGQLIRSAANKSQLLSDSHP